MPLEALGLVLVSVLLLWFGADWVVESASALARKFGMSDLFIGLTVVAFGTSAPEFLVSGTAAFKGLPAISLSNVVGSNIINLGLVLGLMAIIRPVGGNSTVCYRDGGILLGASMLVPLLAMNGHLSRLEGFLLLLLLVGYLTLLWTRRGTLPPDMAEPPGCREATWKDWPKLVLGFVGLSLGGDMLVDASTTIALAFGVSEWFIGLTIVAGGTSLPELVTCLAASLKGRNDMLLGNLIGSNLFNYLGVLGMTSALQPLTMSPQTLPGMIFLIGMIAATLFFIRTGWRVSRLEGAALVGLNILRWIMDYSR